MSNNEKLRDAVAKVSEEVAALSNEEVRQYLFSILVDLHMEQNVSPTMYCGEFPPTDTEWMDK